MLLASILITSPGEPRPELPRLIAENVESLKRNHPELPHRLFGEEEVVALLKDKFPPEVLDSYSALRPFAYRADLARYCILHEFGGLYADLSYFFVDSVPMSEDRVVVFRGNLVCSPWDTSNGIIYAPPKHKALAKAIELVCANVKRRYYGETGLCPTGPTLFGKALATTCEADEIKVGFAKLTPRDEAKQLLPRVALPEGPFINLQRLGRTIIAVKRKRPTAAGLSELGVTSGNAYGQFWNKREVYS